MLSIGLIASLMVLGAIVGVLAGLLGIGGGVVVVPALSLIFPLFGMPTDIAMHVALGTSLATAILTTGSSAFNHFKLGNVVMYAVMFLLPGIIFGGFFGSTIVQWLPSHYLPKVFGVIVFIISVQMLMSIRTLKQRPMPNRIFTIISGAVLGTLATLAGISGGSLCVPFLNRYGIEMKKSVGSASVCGFVIAISGVLGFIWHGSHIHSLPKYNIGYIYLPALVFISCMSIFTTRVGAKLATRLPTSTLKKIFSVFLMFISINMLMR